MGIINFFEGFGRAWHDIAVKGVTRFGLPPAVSLTLVFGVFTFCMFFLYVIARSVKFECPYCHSRIYRKERGFFVSYYICPSCTSQFSRTNNGI